jgi:signal transduction histidine kinase
VKLRALIIEDSEDDALLILSELEAAGYEVEHQRVYSKQGMLGALRGESEWDIILSDHNLPGFSSTEALLLLLQHNIDIPLIIVSGTIGEEVAVEAMKAGAQDFVMKGHLSKLAPAVGNALEAARAKRESRQYQQRLRELTMHLQTVREEERAMIAREIHDELGGLLTALKMDIRWLARRFAENFPDADEKFSVMSMHLDNAIKTVRRIITDLRPSVLDDLGLVAALEWQLDDFAKRYEIATRFNHALATRELPEKQQEVTVFRIFQESLTNIARHAKASRVEVDLIEHDGAIELTIRDNGIGIADENKLKKGSYGILGMNERAMSLGATLEVRSNNGGGTQVVLNMPINNKTKRDA